MAIRISTNKTVVNGVRGREIKSIKALRKDQLPAEYVLWDGAVYSRPLRTRRGTCLYIHRAISEVKGVVMPHALLKTGRWLSEEKFQSIKAILLKAGNQLVEINKQLLVEWDGDEIVVISALGVVDNNTIAESNQIKDLLYRDQSDGPSGLLIGLKEEVPPLSEGVRVCLLTSKTKRNRKRLRVLKDSIVIEYRGALSTAAEGKISAQVLAILTSAGLPDYVITEKKFQRVLLKLRHAIRYAENRSWRGTETIKI